MNTERHVRDGVPHFTYFDKANNLSFVWDGNPAHDIEVEQGGYGEPVIDTIKAPNEIPARVQPWVVLASFKGRCDAWTRVVQSRETMTGRVIWP